MTTKTAMPPSKRAKPAGTKKTPVDWTTKVGFGLAATTLVGIGADVLPPLISALARLVIAIK